MKRLVLGFALVLLASLAMAQSPFQFNFQAVARNIAGNPLTNQAVDFRLSILQGTMDGTAVYIEEQAAATNNFGLANLLVGSGTASLGNLSTVDWAVGPYFLQVELDIQNGEGYQLMGVSALASVPYALHAKTSEQAGPVGPAGAQGEQGAQGETGPGGVSVVGSALSNDSLSFTLSDGSVLQAGVIEGAASGASASQGLRVGFSQNSTWTCPEGVSQITLELWGGGGGSGSSSGYSLYTPGTSCFVSADGSPCSPTVQGLGAPGGAGGSGGYLRTTVAVTPGVTYTIVVGTGGDGGDGGFGVNVNSGTGGANGQSTAFMESSTILAEADGGIGGGVGNVNCCNWPSIAVCPGWTAGSTGADGTQLNFISPISTPDSRSYIPADYMTPTSSCCAAGGSIAHQNVNSSGTSNHSGFGGSSAGLCNSGGACINVSNCAGDDVEVSPFPGETGESGFVSISY